MYKVINLEKKDHSNKYNYLVKILKLPRWKRRNKCFRNNEDKYATF